MLCKAVSSTNFKVFGMTRSGMEPPSSGPLANTLLIRPMPWVKRKEKDRKKEIYNPQKKKKLDNGQTDEEKKDERKTERIKV